MKKINFYINSLEMGGAEKVLVDLVLRLDKEKYKIAVITSTENDTYLSKKIKDNIEYDYLISKQNLKFLNKIPFFNKSLISFFKKIKFYKVSKNKDILIDFLDGDFSKYIRKIKKVKKICWLHLSYDIVKKRKRKIDEKLEIYDNVVIICNEIKEEIKKDNKDLLKKITVIHNFVDIESHKKEAEKLFAKEEENLLKNSFFLSVCRLDETQKDIKTLIKAYSKYKGKSMLYIIGEGKSRKEIENLIEELGLEKKVLLLGERKNPYQWMKKCKALILSSKTEGLPTVLIEALGLGCKVISSECKTGPREILLNGEIGELFLVGDEIELLHKLEIIEEKEYDIEKIKKSLYRFDKDNVLKKVEGLFE